MRLVLSTLDSAAKPCADPNTREFSRRSISPPVVASAMSLLETPFGSLIENSFGRGVPAPEPGPKTQGPELCACDTADTGSVVSTLQPKAAAMTVANAIA